MRRPGCAVGLGAGALAARHLGLGLLLCRLGRGLELARLPRCCVLFQYLSLENNRGLLVVGCVLVFYLLFIPIVP